MKRKPSNQPIVKRGYVRAFDRHAGLKDAVGQFDSWIDTVEDWLDWINKNIPDGAYVSKKEAIEDFHVTLLGLRLFERAGFDLTTDLQRNSRTEYDLKKLLRTLVIFPTLIRLKGRRLSRRYINITTILKEVVNDAVNGTSSVE